MENLSAGDLTIEAAPRGAPSAISPTSGPQQGACLRGDPKISLSWRGKSNHRHPSKVLGPYFERVLAAALEQSAHVEMHFEKLEHFNSSTITSIIQLIQDARARGVRLVLVYDQALKWQQLSFDALRVLAKNDGLLELRSV